MKYKEFDTYIRDEDEPIFRSCWECNSAHEHLKDTTRLHSCSWCNRYWIFGHYFDEFETPEALDAFLKDKLEAA
jgi:hypothetical protein